MMGAVFTEKEIRELIARMEDERSLRGFSSAAMEAYRHCADLLGDLLKEHGL